MTRTREYDDGTEGADRPRSAGATVASDARAWLGDDMQVGSGVTIGAGVRLVADRLALGDDVRIGAGADLRSSHLNIGSRCEILPRVTALVADVFSLRPAGRVEAEVSVTCRTFEAGSLFYLGHELGGGVRGHDGIDGPRAHRGPGSALGPHNILNANMPIEIGDQVRSGCYLSIWTHGFHFGHRATEGFDATFEGVRIEPNVWLGFHVTVLPGVVIGADTIIAGGAVVARDLPGGVLAGGVPAKPIKSLARRVLPDDEMWARVEELLTTGAPNWPGRRSRTNAAVLVRSWPDRAVGCAWRPPTRGRTWPPMAVSSSCSRSIRGRTCRAKTAPLTDLRTGALHGELSLVGHDLRDHLRRHALPCGDQDTFRGLPSSPFARLTAAVPLSD